MTPQRIWLDSTAEREFWRLMQDYEALHPQTVGTGRLWDLLTFATLRRRGAIRRLDEIRSRAQVLVQRYSMRPPVAAPGADAVEEPPLQGQDSHRLQDVLRRTATLANDRGARSGRKQGQASGAKGDV